MHAETRLMHEVWLHNERAVGVEEQRAHVRAGCVAHAQRAASGEHDKHLLAVVPVNGRARLRRKGLLPNLHLR
jgi:hypothetical protein